MLFWPSVCLLWRSVFRSAHFLIGLFVFFDIELHELLYILEINPLSVASFANIFSHSEGCLFVLFLVSFAVQKLLSLIRSHLFIFIFPQIFVLDSFLTYASSVLSTLVALKPLSGAYSQVFIFNSYLY